VSEAPRDADTEEGEEMNITISRIPGTDGYHVWINSTQLYMTRKELLALNTILTEELK
jgi:hypothetical protein